VDQIAGTNPAEDATPAAPDAAAEPSSSTVEEPGFAARGRMRRRLRFLRKARELAYRDLGGLVFNLHRFGQRNDALVIAKLNTIGDIDSQLRALEAELKARQPVTVLREAGITACVRCAAIHASEDRFCPNCGLALGRHADLPIAVAAPLASAPAPPSSAQPAPSSQPDPRTQRAQPAAPPSAQPAPSAPAAASAAPVASKPPVPARAPTPPTAPRGSRGGAGRAPTPPTAIEPSPPTADEPTEILRPPAGGG
jgi:hypothetical protein